jgi:hypothetical protein
MNYIHFAGLDVMSKLVEILTGRGQHCCKLAAELS